MMDDLMKGLWPNQQQALTQVMSRPATMLDMDMGTGKTLVAIRSILAYNVQSVLVVCPKAVMPVWEREIIKHGPYSVDIKVWTANANSTVSVKASDMEDFISNNPGSVKVCVVNYDIVWRGPMRTIIDLVPPEMVILDESHRAKAAGSKVSKYLAMVGKRTRYRLCLSGTPMANSPLDLYGQYRFLDPTIFGTRFDGFRDQYAILGGPERNFVVGYKNQDILMAKFRTIAYSCKMEDIKDRIKLPDKLPHSVIPVTLPNKDMKLSRDLAKEFIAQDESGGVIALPSVLHKLLRLQQITSGFAVMQDNPLEDPYQRELNTAKEDALSDLMLDMPSSAFLVVFVVFKHDIDATMRAATKAKKNIFEISGRANQLEEWRKYGGVLVVQIQAGAEGIDLTVANTCVYYSLPTSLALYEQSLARLYRPGQTKPVNFIHLVAQDTIDEDMLDSINNKRSMFEDFANGKRDFGFIKTASR